MKRLIGSTVLALSLLGATAISALAQDTLKIGYVDPLSGGGASIGQIGMNQLNFITDEINAKGGVNGKKVEIVGYDNQTNPQISLVQVQKAIDEGIKVIVQGNGSSVAVAVSDFITKYNDRNPGANIVHLNYAAIDPVLTNEKCSYWHFTWDASAAIKMEALTNFIKDKKDVKKVYLISQDYSFGHAVAGAAKSMLQAKRPDVEIVGDEFHPLVKITDFAPYVAKIKASGADTVITGNWGQDLALLIKAAGQAGLDVDWYTFYAGGAGGPTAIKQANLADRVFQINEGINNQGYGPAEERAGALMKRFANAPVYYPRMFNMMDMVFQAMTEAKSEDPGDFVPKLEGMKHNSFAAGAEGFLRADDHQFFQPLYISTLGPLDAGQKFDEEHTGWGWKMAAEIPTESTLLPTTCEMKRP
ncbi:branched-chain amino acid ABC transporter substrate-binding protein [Mesorhizobium australicum]|uniref:Amino acid/amide ABC transporter substrate-binding protein, HAAT family n=1 Tax=Mesorhizobium australicum TaxID=536018 RepID=A0A1X7PSE5_9HYPH|nr:branched-chain amino acid ABC transporter substrate-binding protein [Mesorhizobium australicum]SMH54425.1 amino acid/amide ABC transporter substrate-binding protein, HAAT family [Mesorhizobium australicum]